MQDRPLSPPFYPPKEQEKIHPPKEQEKIYPPKEQEKIYPPKEQEKICPPKEHEETKPNPSKQKSPGTPKRTFKFGTKPSPRPDSAKGTGSTGQHSTSPPRRMMSYLPAGVYKVPVLPPWEGGVNQVVGE